MTADYCITCYAVVDLKSLFVLYVLQELFEVETHLFAEKPQKDIHSFIGTFSRVSFKIFIFVPLQDQTGRWSRYLFDLSVCLFISLFISYQTCERVILKTNVLILMQIGRSSLWGKGMKHTTLGSGGHRSRSLVAKNGFGGLVEASIWTPWSRVGFLINFTAVYA